MKYPISRPSFPDLGDQFVFMFAEAMVSGRVTNHGPHVQALERELADYLDVAECVCVSSGTAALVVMLKALGVGEGDEVICPAFTFCATPHAVRLTGATPVFADVLAGTLHLDPDDVARRTTPRTKAIMPVDVYGSPADAEEFVGRFVHDIPVVFDAAPSFGAVTRPESVGSRGRACAFSFHATKPFSTMEGGCISTNDRDLARRARMIANFGIWPSGLAQVVGLNAHMLEVSALVGLAALPLLERAIARRSLVAAKYRVGLPPGVRFPQPSVACVPTWCYFPVLVDPYERDGIRSCLADRGVDARPYYVSCHTMPAYKSPEALPATEAAAAGVLCLPVYSDQTDAEIAYVIEAFREAVA